LALARRTWLFTICLWLSLATVLGHALSPIASPLAQKSGSAFSASTWEVSLGAPRTGAGAKLKRGHSAPDDEGSGPDLTPPVLVASAPALPAPFGDGPEHLATPDPFPAPFGPGGGFQARAPPLI